MKFTKITHSIPDHMLPVGKAPQLWSIIENIQEQVQEQHLETIWKHCRVVPYSLSKEVLDIMGIRLVVSPQHNQQWLEQRGQRIGPIIQTTLSFVNG